MLELSGAAVVDFPLAGEWTALNTPAHTVPSHGTDYFGQRFALDFIRIDWDTNQPCAASIGQQFLGSVPAESFYCWDQPVRAAFDGRVVASGDGWRDRMRVNAVWELFRASFVAPFALLLRGPRSRDYRPLTGNYVLIEGDPGVALYAHLRRGSVRVATGDDVSTGSEIGRVGNSGNSTMPHLHFHLMDGADPYTAAGRLCAFRNYERFSDGRWEPVPCGVPGRLEPIRSA